MQRSHESYLDLITREHQLIKNEIQIMESFRKSEESERTLFEKFSNKLRDAHEVCPQLFICFQSSNQFVLN